MLNVTIHHSLAPLKGKWQSFTPSSVYLDYSIMRKLASRSLFYRFVKKMTFLYAEVKKDGRTVMIAPLKKRGNAYSTIGRLLGYPISDFLIDGSLGDGEIADAIIAICRTLRTDTLSFAGVPEDSRLKKAIDGSDLKVRDEMSESAIAIHVGPEYDAYYASLTKHSRQNVRTAYNRMATDGKTYDIQILPCTSLGRRQLNELLDVYFRRQREKYDMNYSGLRRFFFRYLDFPTAYQNDRRANYYLIMRIDGAVAGFMSGITDHARDCTTIVRLAIVDDFARYSPGIVMVNEAAKSLYALAGVNALDMSLGDETYKLAMGGERYGLAAFTVVI